MKIATCTPVDFPADSQFFGRDSGLLCRGFQAAGHQSVVVMPGVRRTDNPSDVVRCKLEDLTSPSWWRELGVELVVLYAWCDPRNLDVAEAIRKAGIFLVQSLDSSGIHTPYGGRHQWWQCLRVMLDAPLSFGARACLLARAVRDLVPTLYESRRLKMMDCCDRLAVVSEPAAEAIAAYSTALGHPQIAGKLVVVPHPISELMTPAKESKMRKVLVVGRWLAEDKVQKDPELTMAVLDRFLHQYGDWIAEVVGRGSSGLEVLTGKWSPECRARLTLTEAVPRDQLVIRYQQSRILLCCSRFESFHISSAEALCCGCSIVVADHPLLASTGWFTTRNSGTKAHQRSLHALQDALVSDASAWENNQRDPQQIAHHWARILHAKMVAEKLLTSLGKTN